MFEGEDDLTLDAKGRMPMPARHRDALTTACGGQLTLVRHPDGCLVVYPRPRWDEKRAELVLRGTRDRWLQRLVLGSARPVEVDTAGRFLVPYELRRAAALERDVKLVGQGPHLELWDAPRYEQLLSQSMGNADPLDGDNAFKF
jgi:MraZ protein